MLRSVAYAYDNAGTVSYSASVITARIITIMARAVISAIGTYYAVRYLPCWLLVRYANRRTEDAEMRRNHLFAQGPRLDPGADPSMRERHPPKAYVRPRTCLDP